MAPNYTTPAIQLVKGKGSRVEDSEGRSYLDLLAGIAVNILGHAHPDIVKAVSTQVGLLSHTSNLFANPPSLRLAERLQKTTEDFAPGGYKTIFQNSGTEANEGALKLVRRHAHAKGMPGAVVIAFDNSFHGRTTGAVKLTGQKHYQEGFDPLPTQVVHVPFNDAAALEKVFATQQVAGVFFESVQGEGGVLPLTAEAAAALRRLSQAHDAILVADEVQTGVGRTGKFYGFQHDGLTPDVITLAKGLGGGLPIGAILIHPKRTSLFAPGAHGTTFGGNAVACAAGNAVLDVLERDALIPRAGRLGAHFMQALAEAGAPARGRGLLVGVPLDGPKAPEVVTALRKGGILAGQAGKSVLRIAPPLNISEADLLGAVPAILAAIGSAKAPATVAAH